MTVSKTNEAVENRGDGTSSIGLFLKEQILSRPEAIRIQVFALNTATTLSCPTNARNSNDRYLDIWNTTGNSAKLESLETGEFRQFRIFDDKIRVKPKLVIF